MSDRFQNVIRLDHPDERVRLRTFNRDGIEAFRGFLDDLRHDSTRPVAWNLLQDIRLTELVEPAIWIPPKYLNTRGDAAEYLAECLPPLPEEVIRHHVGLWTWLTLFLFDSVCPVISSDGNRKIRVNGCYIFEPDSNRYFCRHHLFLAWYTKRVAGEYSRMYLQTPVYVQDAVTFEVMSRLFLTRIPCIFEVLERLYLDPKTWRPRVGTVSKDSIPKRGDLNHRFVQRIRQLEKTYDLPSLNADQLMELLGKEFDFC